MSDDEKVKWWAGEDTHCQLEVLCVTGPAAGEDFRRAATEADLAAAGYVPASQLERAQAGYQAAQSQLADVTAKLEAAEGRVREWKLNQEATRLALEETAAERDQFHDLLHASRTKLLAAEGALEQAYVLAEEVGAIVGLDDDESLQTRLATFRDAYARRRSATEGAKPAEGRVRELEEELDFAQAALAALLRPEGVRAPEGAKPAEPARGYCGMTGLDAHEPASPPSPAQVEPLRHSLNEYTVCVSCKRFDPAGPCPGEPEPQSPAAPGTPLTVAQTIVDKLRDIAQTVAELRGVAADELERAQKGGEG